MPRVETFDTKSALTGLQMIEDAARVLREIPELIPVAQRMLESVLTNGHVEESPVRGNRQQQKKLHWTQRPENRAKVMKLARKMQKGK